MTDKCMVLASGRSCDSCLFWPLMHRRMFLLLLKFVETDPSCFHSSLLCFRLEFNFTDDEENNSFLFDLACPK